MEWTQLLRARSLSVTPLETPHRRLIHAGPTRYVRGDPAAEVVTLRGISFLTHEFLAAEASALLHEFDVAKAFNATYATADAWQAAIPGLEGGRQRAPLVS